MLCHFGFLGQPPRQFLASSGDPSLLGAIHGFTPLKYPSTYFCTFRLSLRQHLEEKSAPEHGHCSMKYEPVASLQGNARSKWGLGLEFAAFCPRVAMEGKDALIFRECFGAFHGLFPWIERPVLLLHAPKTPYPLLQCQLHVLLL